MSRRVGKGVMVALIVLCTTTPAEAMCLQSWDKKIENPQRFHVLGDFHAAAVLDQETGLVWERDPTFFEPGNVGALTNVGSWLMAVMACMRKSVGARKGWRLPSVHELATLVDGARAADALRLPPGHPFLHIGTDGYWTATTQAAETGRAWVVRFLGGDVVTEPKEHAHPFWCVRGGAPGPD